MQSQILTSSQVEVQFELANCIAFKLHLPRETRQNPRDETDSARPMGDHSWHHPHARIGECNSRNARKCNHDRVCVPEL